MAVVWRTVAAAILLVAVLYSIGVVLDVSSSVQETKLSTVEIHRELQLSLQQQQEAIVESKLSEELHLRDTLRHLDAKLEELSLRRERSESATSELLKRIRAELVEGQQQLAAMQSSRQNEARDQTNEKLRALLESAGSGGERLQELASALEEQVALEKNHEEEIRHVLTSIESLRLQVQSGGGERAPLQHDDSADIGGGAEAGASSEEDHCIGGVLDGIPVEASLEKILALMPPASPITTPPGGFPTTLQELLVEDTPSVLLRLGFPSTSSTLLRSMIERIGSLSADERLPECGLPRVVGCGYMRAEALNRIQSVAGNLTTLPDVGQHVSLGYKIRGVQRQISENEQELNSEPIVITMLREPAQYAHRIFADRQPTGKSFEEERQSFGVVTVSHTLLHFDLVFEQETQCSLDVATEEQWIDLAHWRWNYFTRGLADDYNLSLWMTRKNLWSRTREQEWALNLEGSSSSMLRSAIENLNSFAFFGIFDRLEESMELFAFTFCVDFDALDFVLRSPGKVILAPEEHLLRGADAIGELAYAVMRERNVLDFLLFEYAEALFERRVEMMRQAKRLGYACLLPDSSCGIAC